MKADKQAPELTAAERALQQRLEHYAEPARPVTWQELSARQTARSGTTPRPRRWPLWLTPLAAAAAVAWFWVVQPQQLLPVPVSDTPMLLASNYSLDAIDRQLQQAYIQGADEAKINALWQRREQLTTQEI
ncbi:hypothetical protein [Pseudidiomarina terrestris]|uniref:Anti-sigma factor n=1 Tax=Pseudidiomarina terrestris TaxID=2820060 RepID=A0ABT8MEC8_9GAMM|nr:MULTISPECIES: hypothetical protein [unclassified Pseudidiomarina]MDN7127109.1 hypothetical protein [Pseudidiomarina sp. 1APR75-33.1]MDN7128294.1 hypothetical protein [Pseudidiomarina sp. 1APR75-15]MDN7135478.1 hypothetical protein [Pseudidiomarina sp. 1ASP75-5]MDN7138490.1 hypothetical protein [Pseudidiomarina sp. 1ASP75-14]